MNKKSNKEQKVVMDKRYNNEISKLKRKELYYLPWIGDNFANSKTKLLILGESNYIDKNRYGEEKDWNQTLIKNNFTQGIEKVKPHTVLNNLLRAIYNRSEIYKNEKCNFAEYIAFSNIVQRPLKNSQDRPKNDDFLKGWKIMLELIKIINPENIIIIGVTSIDYLLKTDNLDIEINKGKKNDSVYPREFLLPINGKKINCIAIKHTASYFSWEKWHKYINKKINLKEIIN